MARGSKYPGYLIALLVVGSAISLMSCDGPKESEIDDEKLISRTVRDMEMLQSENGKKLNMMRARLMEEHAFAKAPFEEYRQGIEFIGYDSLGQAPASSIVADYALHWKERDLWQLSGNVLAEGEDGQKLYTQQLFYDVKTKKIWSNVDAKVEQEGDVLTGVGFEALDDFSQWRFRGVTGTVGVDVEPAAPATDSLAAGAPGVDSLAAATPVPPVPPEAPAPVTSSETSAPSASSTPSETPAPPDGAAEAADSPESSETPETPESPETPPAGPGAGPSPVGP